MLVVCLYCGGLFLRLLCVVHILVYRLCTLVKNLADGLVQKEKIKQNDDERVDQSEDYSVKIYADQRKLCLLGGFLGYSQHIRHFTSILSCCSLPEIKPG